MWISRTLKKKKLKRRTVSPWQWWNMSNGKSDGRMNTKHVIQK